MSKAFTRESDEDDLPPPIKRTPLPPGVKNYMTAGGAESLRKKLAEWNSLKSELRAGSTTTDRQTARLQRIDQEIRDISNSLASAEVVDPSRQDHSRVRFGASVTVRHTNGTESSYRIVGVDETDIDRGWVSCLSPLARALINAEIGSKKTFRFPSGEEQLEVIRIAYE
jgi:transcription elongation factor GreB